MNRSVDISKSIVICQDARIASRLQYY